MTSAFGGQRSIQLSYGCAALVNVTTGCNLPFDAVAFKHDTRAGKESLFYACLRPCHRLFYGGGLTQNGAEAMRRCARKTVLPTCGLIALVLVAVTLNVGAARADSAAVAALKQPQTFAMMRHALAPGFSDPEHFTIGDCRSQRNLNAAGREQARATGKAVRDAGITFDRVLSSQWCRCRETAELLNLGPVEEVPALNSFFEAPQKAAAQTAALKALMAQMPAGAKIMLVSHFVNISAYLQVAVGSGEMVIARKEQDGAGTVLERFLIAP